MCHKNPSNKAAETETWYKRIHVALHAPLTCM